MAHAGHVVLVFFCSASTFSVRRARMKYLRWGLTASLFILVSASLLSARVHLATEKIQLEWCDAKSAEAGPLRPIDIYGGVYTQCFETPAENDSAVGWKPWSWVRFDSIDFGSEPITAVRVRGMGRDSSSGGFKECRPLRKIQIRLESLDAPSSGNINFDSCPKPSNMCLWRMQDSRLTTPITGMHTVYIYKYDATASNWYGDWIAFGTDAGIWVTEGPSRVVNTLQSHSVGTISVATRTIAVRPSTSGAVSVRLYRLDGTVAAAISGNSSTVTLSTGHLARGAYLLSVKQGNNTLTKRIGIQ
jgi:hypothetical protein